MSQDLVVYSLSGDLMYDAEEGDSATIQINLNCISSVPPYKPHGLNLLPDTRFNLLIFMNKQNGYGISTYHIFKDNQPTTDLVVLISHGLLHVKQIGNQYTLLSANTFSTHSVQRVIDKWCPARKEQYMSWYFDWLKKIDYQPFITWHNSIDKFSPEDHEKWHPVFLKLWNNKAFL